MFICTCKGLSEQAVTTSEPNIESKVFKRRRAHSHIHKEANGSDSKCFTTEGSFGGNTST